MTLAEMRQWAQDANWGPRKCDVRIAATALVLSAPLVTNNPRDYRHLDNLQLISAAAG
jgi:predicted nucleic acid-binding protein